MLTNMKKFPNDKWGCCIILYDPNNSNRFLLIKRAPGSRQEPETWGLPGGKVETGETAEEAIHRELYEETSLETSYYKYIGCLTKDGWIDFVFLADHFSGKVNLNEESTEYAWVTMDHYKEKDIFSYTREAIELYENWKKAQVYKVIEKARSDRLRQLP